MFWILSTIMFQSLSIILLKKAAITIGAFSIEEALMNKYYVASLLSLISQAIAWQQAIKDLDISKAYMFMSSVQIIVIIASYLFFKEAINLQNILGSIVIIAGLNLLYKNIISYKEI